MANLIFDLDGTLIDSAPDLHAAAVLLLREEGQEPLDLATIRSFIGNGVPVLVERIMQRVFGTVDPVRHGMLEKRFMAHYEAAPTALTRLYPGVDHAIKALVTQGHRLALCTNKPAATSRTILRDLGIAGYFGAVIGGDTLRARKPDPAPLHAAIDALGDKDAPSLYVGDSEIDAKAAHAAGLPFLLFTKGYRNVPVTELRFTASFEHFDELPSLVAAQIEG